MSNIVIIDFLMGNHFSIEKRVKGLGHQVVISNSKDEIAAADKIILPGVGHFAKAMESMQKLDLISILNDEVLLKKKPILGICLGMQLMSSFSEEGNVEGLGWFDAQVQKIHIQDTAQFKVPHTGWNSVNPKVHTSLFMDLSSEADFYFLHSYYFNCKDEKDILATTTLEKEFASAVNKDHIFGVQFHPEKSHDNGIRLLSNFLSL